MGHPVVKQFLDLSSSFVIHSPNVQWMWILQGMLLEYKEEV